jgi:hypothetical protein
MQFLPFPCPLHLSSSDHALGLRSLFEVPRPVIYINSKKLGHKNNPDRPESGNINL